MLFSAVFPSLHNRILRGGYAFRPRRLRRLFSDNRVAERGSQMSRKASGLLGVPLDGISMTISGKPSDPGSSLREGAEKHPDLDANAADPCFSTLTNEFTTSKRY